MTVYQSILNQFAMRTNTRIIQLSLSVCPYSQYIIAFKIAYKFRITMTGNYA